jgi:hypothetical protein
VFNFYDGEDYSINNPLYFSHRERHRESFGMPFVPVLWYHARNTRSGVETKSLLTLFAWENDGQGETKGIWNPLLLHRDDEYTHLPLLLSYWNYAGGETALFNPLWFSYEQGSSSYFGFPVLPFLWYSYDGDDYSRRTLLGMFSWKTGRGDEPSSGIGPGYYYEINDSFTRKLIGPWYHYEKADGTKSNTVLFPVYYSYRNTKKDYSLSLSPVHYSREEGEDDRFWCLLWYSDEKPSEQYDLWTIVPFYYSRTTSRNSLSISPLAVRYTDHEKGKYYYVNLALFARSVTSGPFKPVTDVGVGRIDDTWHGDFNLSWMYSVFEYYQRVPLRNPFTAEDIRRASADDIAQSEDSLSEEELAARLQDIDSYPQLQDEREDNKELALKYWGWSVLFGMLAYEQVEDETHFRWLPLCWLTWNEKSADNLNYIFAWKLDYENRYNDEEYYAFFPVFLPIYGKHRRGESFQQAFVLNAFWREYAAETHEWEYTVLWPLINWYHGDTRYGSRVVPFYWHKHYRESEDSEHDWLIGLPFFRHEQKVTGKEYSYSLRSINPLWYHRQDDTADEYSRLEWYPLLPVYYEKEHADSKGSYRSRRVLYSLYSDVEAEDRKRRSAVSNRAFGL